jgi:uncharacterized membrane protein
MNGWISSEAAIAILGMAIVTYATRAGGLWLINRTNPSRFVTNWLKYIPGTVLVALIAPTVLAEGGAEAIAALVTILVMVRTSKVLLAMVAGVLAVWILRVWL